jgi:hypothetical protein
MNRLLTALLTAVALLATAAVTVAQKPKPPGQTAVTLTAGANPVKFGIPLVLTTSVKGTKAGQQVKLQRRNADGTYTDLFTAATNDKGDVPYTQRPSRNTTYRATTVEATPRSSADLLVKVAPVVGLTASDSTPRKGARVTFRGTVRPAHDGRKVSIQRKRADGTWVTITKPVLVDAGSTSSRYSKRLTIRATAVYRVVIAEHADHAAGVSRERTLTVG